MLPFTKFSINPKIKEERKGNRILYKNLRKRIKLINNTEQLPARNKKAKNQKLIERKITYSSILHEYRSINRYLIIQVKM